MRNLDTPGMITATKKQTTAETDIPRKPCIPATEIWRLISRGTEKGEYEPQVVKKYQNTVTQDMEEKILSMYAKGMTTNDIESHMRELYDIEIPDSTISRITDKILPSVKEWQERPLEEIYAVVFLDAIHFHVRSEGRIVKQAVYIAIGIDMSGRMSLVCMLGRMKARSSGFPS